MTSHVSQCMSLQDTWLAWNVNRNEGGVRKEKRNGGKERKGKEKREREKKVKGKEREKDEGGWRFLPQFIGIPTVGTRWTKE